jgi:hypothetical protein
VGGGARRRWSDGNLVTNQGCRSERLCWPSVPEQIRNQRVWGTGLLKRMQHDVPVLDAARLSEIGPEGRDDWGGPGLRRRARPPMEHPLNDLRLLRVSETLIPAGNGVTLEPVNSRYHPFASIRLIGMAFDTW